MKLERLFLSLLALLPSKSIAFVAEARLNDLKADQRLSPASWDSILRQKASLFEPMQMETTYEAALERFRSSSGILDEAELQRAFNTLISDMKKSGLIETTVAGMSTGVPSQH